MERKSLLLEEMKKSDKMKDKKIKEQIKFRLEKEFKKKLDKDTGLFYLLGYGTALSDLYWDLFEDDKISNLFEILVDKKIKEDKARSKGIKELK